MIPTVFLPKPPDIKESIPKMHFRLCERGVVISLDALTGKIFNPKS
jgi:hypothetical protein